MPSTRYQHHIWFKALTPTLHLLQKLFPPTWCTWFMDIDLFWTFGGCYWFLLDLEISLCMAGDRESFATSNVQASLRLLVLFFFLFATPSSESKIPTASSFSYRRLLSPLSSQSMNLHPRNSSSTPQWEASAHEVPSGPNPISNR